VREAANPGGVRSGKNLAQLLDCRRLACRARDVLFFQGLWPCWMRDASNPAGDQPSRRQPGRKQPSESQPGNSSAQLLDCRRLACRARDVLFFQGLWPCWMRDASNPAGGNPAGGNPAGGNPARDQSGRKQPSRRQPSNSSVPAGAQFGNHY